MIGEFGDFECDSTVRATRISNILKDAIYKSDEILKV